MLTSKLIQSIQRNIVSKIRFDKSNKQEWHGTTILAVKKNQEIFLIGDGLVTQGSQRVKTDGKKIRKLSGGTAVCGFAGSLADAFTLMEGLEATLQRYSNQTLRACIQYAKEWRTGKHLRHLEATLVVCDKDLIVEIDGTGNVIEIHDVIGIGSGGLFAECAARALLDHTQFNAQEIGEKAMKIAADKCIYTNHNFTSEKVTW